MPRPNREQVFALLAFVLPVALYCTSAQRYVQFWDTGEFQTVPYILGIAHPTGFPAYVLIAFVFSHVVAIGSVAFRMSLFSAVCVGVACSSLYVALRRWEVNVWCAAVAAALFAFGPITLMYAIRAEVHTLALGFESLALTWMLLWRGSGHARDLLAGFGFEGLALATHPIAIWMLPGLFIIVISNRKSLQPRLTFAAFGALMAPLLLYLYMPLRSAIVYNDRLDPTLALGIAPGSPFWDYGHPANLSNFLWMVTGAQFHRDAGFWGIFHPGQYPHYFSELAQLATTELGPIFVFFSLAGIYWALRKDKVLATGLIICGICFVPFSLAYTEEADKPRYLLETLWINACFIGLGIDLIVSAVSKRLPSLAAALPVVAATGAAFQFYTEPNLLFQPQNDLAAEFVQRVVANTPPSAVIVAPWIYVTPMGYSAYAAHRFGNRIPYNAQIEDSIPTILRLALQRPTYVVLDKKFVPGLNLKLVDRGRPNILRVVYPQTRANSSVK